uniref:Uncharacterized protein n=1 Tax=Spongospora subterranea TaxID=70186 RepID=A0A0H5R062_9EUKA|eukprot:CRZ07505.1 hypothetical protein [Spongospora subterranea]
MLAKKPSKDKSGTATWKMLKTQVAQKKNKKQLTYTTRTKMQLKKQTSSPKTSVPSTNPWTPVRFNSNALSRTFRAQDTLQVFKILTAANDCCSSYVFLRDVVKSARLPHHDHAFTFDLPDSASD